MSKEGFTVSVLGKQGGQCVVRIVGSLTLANVFVFREEIRKPSAAEIILDMTGVPYMDSTGLGALIGAKLFHEQAGRQMALVGLNDKTAALMKMTNVETVFRIYPSLAEAGVRPA